MAQADGGHTEEERVQADEGKREAEGGGFETVEKSKMKCDYCDKDDHLESACPMKAADRRGEVVIGVIVAIVMIPFYAVGFVMGLAWSAAQAGFNFTSDFWPQCWKTIRNKKGEDEAP